MSVWRSFQRRWARFTGRFVRVPYATAGVDVTDLSPSFRIGVAFVPRFEKSGQLNYEDRHARLVGVNSDIRKIQRLDAMIGKLMRPFNGAAAVPAETLQLIQKHVDDVANSFKRVGAYEPKKSDNGFLGNIFGVFSTANDDKPGDRRMLSRLEYTNCYMKGGYKTTQAVARLQLGD